MLGGGSSDRRRGGRGREGDKGGRIEGCGDRGVGFGGLGKFEGREVVEDEEEVVRIEEGVGKIE